jgi:hypothetical protein
MMSSEEGKLLARAAGFYSPWGSERKNRPHRILRRDLFVMLKEIFASSSGTCNPPHSHQGERERRILLRRQKPASVIKM